MAWRTEPTAEMPIVRIDLSEAYAALRQRGKALRRRRLLSSVLAVVVMAGLFSVVGVYYASSIPLPDAIDLPATTTVYYSDGTTVMARLGAQNRVNVTLATCPTTCRPPWSRPWTPTSGTTRARGSPGNTYGRRPA